MLRVEKGKKAGLSLCLYMHLRHRGSWFEPTKAWINFAEQQMIREEVEDKEWKYTGYRHYSKFIALDNDFLVFRRFSVLNAKVCLALQDEIEILEHELATLDEASLEKSTPDIHNGSFGADAGSARARLLQASEKNPANRDQTSSYSITPSLQTDHLSHQKTQRTSGNGWKIISMLSKPWRVKRKGIDSSDYDAKHELYMSDERIDGCISVTIAVAGLVMLIAPLWILEFTSSNKASLAWITGFITLFLCVVTYATAAKPFETLGATAVYSVVLMVFLQIGK
ncbi:uncharacterized protein PAC_12570 [Phialocephala subalpina]|uniref:DUF6594 domain-containing protein n=1 Tax=Phialocephala subalpina TaxID=576137 RepID=A0A1L7XCD3_9HELO|nr:uncharacterized protein PAC_12570 [Phialocephala subalpina]